MPPDRGFGDSKIKIVTVKGTELNATATAIGSSAPSACHIAPPLPYTTRPSYGRFTASRYPTRTVAIGNSQGQPAIGSKIDS